MDKRFQKSPGQVELKDKIGEHIPCGYSMSTIWTFDGIENKTWSTHSWRLHEKVLWILRRAYDEDN